MKFSLPAGKAVGAAHAVREAGQVVVEAGAGDEYALRVDQLAPLGDAHHGGRIFRQEGEVAGQVRAVEDEQVGARAGAAGTAGLWV